MRKLACMFVILLLPVTCFANDAYDIDVVTQPTTHLTKNWIFVVDTSDSMSGVFHKAIAGIRKMTEFPTDDWKFKIITFNNRGMIRRTKWLEGSVDTLESARKWVENPKRHGVSSHGLPAIREALSAGKQDLTMVLITDGGFWSACNNRGFRRVRQELARGQAWRLANGLGMAVITVVGISNSHYSAWCRRCIDPSDKSYSHDYSIPDRWFSNKGKKPSDKDCQGFLNEIGTNNGGGYLLVRSISAHASR